MKKVFLICGVLCLAACGPAQTSTCKQYGEIRTRTHERYNSGTTESLTVSPVCVSWETEIDFR